MTSSLGKGLLVLLALLLFGTGCLPGDERPVPGSLFVTAEPNEATAAGFSTPDGWTVRFERFVTAVGHVRLGEGSCNAYGEPHYSWLFDFTKVGREKVGLVYALGTCSMQFDFRAPESDSPLGSGVSSADITSMRIRGSDAFSSDEPIAVRARGSAERDGVTKHFDWAFRHRYELSKCPLESGDGFVSDVTLAGEDTLTRRIIVRAEELFRTAASDDADFHFDRFAEADADQDGDITLAELADVDAPPAEGEAAGSLAELVYGELLGRIMVLDGGGTCEAQMETGHHW